MKIKQGLKNNQGFTLIGLMAIAGMLSVVTLAGMGIIKYRSTKNNADQKANDTQQLVANLNGSTGAASLAGSAHMEYQALANPDPTDPNNPANPDSPLNPNNPANPNNPDSPNNPNNPTNPANPNYSPPSCASPCHNFTDPDSHITTCMFTNIDKNCLNSQPPLPSGCVFIAEGPGDPKYQPVQLGGQGVACPYSPTCTAPYVVSPRYHECRCPGDVSDCTPFGNPPGGVNAPVNMLLQQNNQMQN